MIRFRRRRAFTLVEMLVTVTILAILVSFVYGAMSAAETTAKIAKTRATIAKLHRLIMARYESFKTRRIPIDMYFSAESGSPITLTPAEKASVRLDAIREIMRQELPERRLDVTITPSLQNYPFSGSGWQKISSRPAQRIVPPSSTCQAYYDYLLQMNADRHPWNTTANSSAECLYLIVTLSCPGGREQFSENEIGDTDNNGWLEFVDGWNRPIGFLRWAPRFIPQYNADSELQVGPDPGNSSRATVQHDPFDTQNVEPGAYQLIPLIYSYGPDGVSDIATELDNAYTSKLLSSGRRSPYNLISGQPSASTSAGLKHFDNIHNHRLEIR